MFEINRNICSSLSRREIEERMIDEVRDYLQLQLDGLLGYVTDYFLVINGRYLDVREEVAGDTDEQGQVVRGEFGDVHVVHGEDDHLEKKGFVISPRPSPRNLISTWVFEGCGVNARFRERAWLVDFTSSSGRFGYNLFFFPAYLVSVTIPLRPKS